MLSGMKTIVIQFIIKYNMKILKSTLMLVSIFLFGIGLFIGSKINEQNENAKYEALRTNYIYNMQTFIFDFESDVEEGRIDSLVANYYIHNFGVIYDELKYYPEKYLEWYTEDDGN